jgi:hypothetical protein
MQRRDLVRAAVGLLATGPFAASAHAAETPAASKPVEARPSESRSNEKKAFDDHVPTLVVLIAEGLEQEVVEAATDLREHLTKLRTETITSKRSIGCCLWIGPLGESRSLPDLMAGYLASIGRTGSTLYATGTDDYLAGIKRLKELIRRDENGTALLPLGLVTNFPVAR